MKIEERKLQKLSTRQRLYFDIMNSGNCLYLRGKPGTAKSAIGLDMTLKLDIKYIDRRLSQIDETDIGLYPVLNDAFSKLEKLGKMRELGYVTEEEFDGLKKELIKTIKSGQVELLHFAVPEWAFNANVEPTIIHLEELNRANVHVRNAALQLLNERQIGDLKLNENVFLMSSGNLGEDDGTEVDEMDLALSNRLVIFDHDLPYEEWIDEYAKYNVWPIIIDYIRAKPEEYYKLPNEKETRYATPRSWTNLSKYIIYKWGKEPRDLKEIIKFLIDNGRSFIGNSITSFVRYCEDVSNLNINDILSNWDSVKVEVMGFNRSRISELISNLRHLDLRTLNERQFNNMLKFLDSLRGSQEKIGNDDELTSFIVHILDTTDEKNYDINSKIIQHFDKKVKKLRDWTSQNLKKAETSV
jgi:hypothetical protein